MKLEDYDRLGMVAATVTLAILAYLATCATAQAEPYTLRFRNPDISRAYTHLRTSWGIVAAPCAPGATWSVVVDIPLGRRTVTAEATMDSVVWSSASNAIEALVAPAPAACLAMPACRFDSDQDGRVGGVDFAAFAAAFGLTWFASP